MPDCVCPTQSTSFLPWFPQRMCVENQCRTNIPSLHPPGIHSSCFPYLSIILPALFTRPARPVQCLLASEHRITLVTLVTTGPSDPSDHCHGCGRRAANSCSVAVVLEMAEAITQSDREVLGFANGQAARWHHMDPPGTS